MKKLGRAGSTLGTVVAAAGVIAIATTGGAVAGGLVTSAKIKNNTIKSIDVRNNSLKGADVADGSIKGADLAESARGYTRIVTKTLTVPGTPDGGTTVHGVDCGPGNVAIGGGGYTVATSPVLFGTTHGILEQSMPAMPSTSAFTDSTPAVDGVAPQAWRTTVFNNDGATSTNVHYAICASK